jgi:hypothetical protein
MSSTPPAMPPEMPPMPKKTSPLVIILAIVGGLAVLVMATCTIGGFFLYRAVKTAFDPALMRTNPGLAMARMAAAVNPNLEVVKYNERTGVIALQDKKTGKVVMFKFDPDTKRLVITDDDGKETTVSTAGDGSNGSVQVQSAEGTVKIGAGAGNKAPAWVPVYPGSSPQGTFASQTSEGESNAFSFNTKDAASKVLTYYQEQLKSGGFNINLISSSDQGGVVQAEDSGKKRTVTVTVGTSSDGTQGVFWRLRRSEKGDGRQETESIGSLSSGFRLLTLVSLKSR